MQRGFAVLLCVCGLLAAPAALASNDLYKWVDEKGVVHYSDKPPAGKSGQKLNVAPQPPLEGRTPKRERGWQEQQQDANERRYQEEKDQKEAQKEARAAEQKCLQARSALASLKQERPLYRMGQDGERIYLEDEERGRFAAGWQKQADTYCR